MPRHQIPAQTSCLVLMVACIAACASTAPPTTPPSSALQRPSLAITPPPGSSAPPSPASTPSPSPSTVESGGCAAGTLVSMSEGQRIGQLFMVGLKRDRLTKAAIAAIASSHFGSVTFTKQTDIGVPAIRALTDRVQALATSAATDRVGFLVAANQEGGRIQGLSGPGFDVMPGALRQGTWAPAVLRRMASRWGRQLRDAGVNLDLAPVGDVVPPGTDAQNAPIGQLQREYGHDPGTVASHVRAFVKGMELAGVATAVKHFPGLGRVVGNTDVTANVDDPTTTVDDAYLEPFAAAIHAGVPFVMVSLASYDQLDPDHQAVFSPAIMQRLLRDTMAFHGVIVSDALGATAVSSVPPATRAVDFIGAGGDMIISNDIDEAEEMAQAIAARAESDAGFAARVKDAALRVLRVKMALGLVPCGT